MLGADSQAAGAAQACSLLAGAVAVAAAAAAVVHRLGELRTKPHRQQGREPQASRGRCLEGQAPLFGSCGKGKADVAGVFLDSPGPDQLDNHQ